MISSEPANPPDLLEGVLQTSLDAILLCRAIRSPEGRIVDFQVVRCNERAAAITRLPQALMLSHSMLTLDPDGHTSGIFDKYKQVTETGLPLYVEHYFARADVWMAQSLARFGDGVLTSWADISALKRAEAARQRETDLLQAILNNTQTGIAVMQSVRDDAGRIVDFRFTHLNPDAERITRRPKGQLIGQLYSTAWPDAQTNGVLHWHTRVAVTGEPAKINGVNLPVGAYNGWYNIRIRPFGDGVIATFVDVTALKQAELANQQQAELLRSVLDNSANAIIAFSAVRAVDNGPIIDFRYVARNAASRRNSGQTDEEVIGQTMRQQWPGVVETGAFERYVRVVETGQPDQFEQADETDQQRAGWSEISVRKWDDGIVLTVVDITDSKQHQQQIEQANRDLLRANENLRQFAYVASHDLQEPLRKIVAFGDMLKTQFARPLGPTGEDIIDRMQASAGRMSALIRDVLAYSRISTHRQPFQPCGLNELFDDLQRELSVECRTVGATLEVGLLPSVPGDCAQLRQLFGNLLANAFKFRQADPPLTVQVQGRLLKPGSLMAADWPEGLSAKQHYYEISITDNGIGFDQKYTERIFQVFQRLNPRQQYEGTGLGLAICKRVVENHHGTITASGRPGEGATFRVYLPAGDFIRD